MRAGGIRGAGPPRRKWLTVADEHAERPADLVDRKFTATRPNQLWVCDMTYLKTRQGFVYLAFVKDVYSRRIVGWHTDTSMRTDLVLDALEMALQTRRPDPGLIHHSDRGSQYTSFRYTRRLDELGINRSVGSIADAYDNAMAESFVATLKKELVKDTIFPGLFQTEIAIFEYISWFNRDRIHSELQDLSPTQFEQLPTTSTDYLLTT